MSPRNIVKEAKKKGLHFIGICDHNSAENVFAAKKIAQKEEIGVIGGMEITSTEIPIHEVVNLVHQLNELAIASHVDREGFGIIGQLGFIPEDLPLDAQEITDPSRKDRISLPKSLPVIASSDAHYLEDIGKTRTGYFIREINTEELRKSFKKEAGRRIIL